MGPKTLCCFGRPYFQTDQGAAATLYFQHRSGHRSYFWIVVAKIKLICETGK